MAAGDEAQDLPFARRQRFDRRFAALWDRDSAVCRRCVVWRQLGGQVELGQQALYDNAEIERHPPLHRLAEAGRGEMHLGLDEGALDALPHRELGGRDARTSAAMIAASSTRRRRSAKVGAAGEDGERERGKSISSASRSASARDLQRGRQVPFLRGDIPQAAQRRGESTPIAEIVVERAGAFQVPPGFRQFPLLRRNPAELRQGDRHSLGVAEFFAQGKPGLEIAPRLVVCTERLRHTPKIVQTVGHEPAIPVMLGRRVRLPGLVAWPAASYRPSARAAFAIAYQA